MYVYVLVLVLSFGFIVSKETKIDGFLDLEWKDSKAEVKKKMLNRKGIEQDSQKELMFGLVSKSENGDHLCFESGIFGKHAVSSWLFLFYKNQFCKASVTTVKQSDVIRKYNEVKEIFESKYGEPLYDFFEFISPYYYGDGYEENAIKLGKAYMISAWVINDCTVGIQITKSLELQFTYEYNPLMSKLAEENEKGQNEDY